MFTMNGLCKINVIFWEDPSIGTEPGFLALHTILVRNTFHPLVLRLPLDLQLEIIPSLFHAPSCRGAAARREGLYIQAPCLGL
jgi:hypothetical protein